MRQQEDRRPVQIRASAQAPDGMIVRDSALFYTDDIAKMFPEEELDECGARASASRLPKAAAAPMGDNYSGPILFEGTASPS